MMKKHKKAWSNPALILISNGNIESKSRASVHEATGHYITVPGHFKAFVNPSSVGFDITVNSAPFYSKDAAIS